MIELKHIKQIKKLSERNGRVISAMFPFEVKQFKESLNCKLTKNTATGSRYNIFNESLDTKMFEMVYLKETGLYYRCNN